MSEKSETAAVVKTATTSARSRPSDIAATSRLVVPTPSPAPNNPSGTRSRAASRNVLWAMARIRATILGGAMLACLASVSDQHRVPATIREPLRAALGARPIRRFADDPSTPASVLLALVDRDDEAYVWL